MNARGAVAALAPRHATLALYVSLGAFATGTVRVVEAAINKTSINLSELICASSSRAASDMIGRLTCAQDGACAFSTERGSLRSGALAV